MKAHLLSDVHAEGNPFTYTPPPGGCDVVLMPGDIGNPRSAGRLESVLAEAARHAPVLYVPGNHEYYGLSMPVAERLLADSARRVSDASPHPVHLLHGGRVLSLGGVTFVGATLWSDFRLPYWHAREGREYSDPAGAMLSAEQGISDFRLVQTGAHGLVTAAYQAELHKAERNSLEHAHGVADSRGEPLAILSHFPPHPGMLDPHFAKSVLNPFFCTDLRWMLPRLPRLVAWVAGHTHHAADFVDAGVRFVVNPKGYQGEASGWHKHLVVEVPGTEAAAR